MNTRSKDTINADPPELLSALSKAESNLMQNINNLKDKVINLKDIINKNLQDEKKRLKTKVNVLKNKIIDLEIQNNNVDQYGRRNNVELSGIPQSVFFFNFEKLLSDINKRKPFLSVITGGFNVRSSSYWPKDIDTTEGLKIFLLTSSNGFPELINK